MKTLWMQGVGLGLALWMGQADAQSATGFVGHQESVVAGERLSSWLLRHPELDDAVALHWLVPSERASQMALRNALVQQLDASRSALQPEGAGLAQRLAQLPVTGRTLVASTDVRWLQGVPAQDPVLSTNDTVVAISRQSAVALLDEDGKVCLLAHAATARAQDYVRACWGAKGLAQIDWAWLVQPDGRVIKVGLGAWNVSAASETALAPGAWLWAPPRSSLLSAAFSDNMARFLSLQLPAEMLFSNLAVLPAPLPEPLEAKAYGLAVTANDWGNVGLLQTPTARMQPAGHVGATLSGVFPYTHVSAMLQPLEWMEFGFRYTDIANRLYGPDIAGTQSYKDKSIDVKLRLLQESARAPELALGVRDIGGTGLFSSEYVVASKRWGNWDTSVGLGWGNLGGRGNVKAPLGFLGDAFKTRGNPEDFSSSQNNYQSFFHGDAALFGGVQWQTNDGQWVLKAELDGNDYQNDPKENRFDVKSPINVGVVYRLSPNIDLTAALERGNTALFSVSVHNFFGSLQTPKLLDKPLPQVMPFVLQKEPVVQWLGVAQEIAQATGWNILELYPRDATLTLVAESNGSIYPQEQVERATTLMHRYAPANVRRFVIQLQQVGLGLARIDTDRVEWVTQRTQAQAPSMRLVSQRVDATDAIVRTPDDKALPSDAPQKADFRSKQEPAAFFSWEPSYHQIIGGPDGFVLYELGVRGNMELRINPSTWVRGEVNQRLLDNYKNFVYDAPSALPRVRTDQRQYVTSSALTLPVLQLTHVAELGNNQYASVYGGMFESMYGGVGGEWLYRPWRSAWAFGVDINRVQQRGFSQNFEFRDYKATTGHATLYWDTGWNGVQANLMVGKYLAGDDGATLQLMRLFDNGVSIGAWATKTSVSAEQFGEGTFDKGIFVHVPFDLMLPKTSPGVASFVWDPLTRDGGARLTRNVSLYDLTHLRDGRSWRWSASEPSETQSRLRSAQKRDHVVPDRRDNMFDDALDTASGVGHHLGSLRSEAWWAAGGMLLAASALDSTVDSWAQNNQSGPWSRMTSITNAVPYAMAAGAGLLWMGVAGDEASATATTAITAAALTLGTNVLTKYAVGRARPLDDRGAGQFDGFQPAAAQSSFASNHVAMAFAIATPFAQAYDQPWLYGLAATTAVGRLQSREHWLSDTVVGGLMGYAIGSLAYEQQQARGKVPRLTVGDRTVTASWSF